ncbi:GNAT family N-acetyltransferase, partial [Bacillus thuringiensis]|nr:GNAT family N-acetyltransferase [Bacillus thuringiensis]
IHQVEQNKVIQELMCVVKLQSYYESIGFEAFSIGMTKHIIR